MGGVRVRHDEPNKLFWPRSTSWCCWTIGAILGRTQVGVGATGGERRCFQVVRLGGGGRVREVESNSLAAASGKEASPRPAGAPNPSRVPLPPGFSRPQWLPGPLRHSREQMCTEYPVLLPRYSTCACTVPARPPKRSTDCRGKGPPGGHSSTGRVRTCGSRFVVRGSRPGVSDSKGTRHAAVHNPPLPHMPHISGHSSTARAVLRGLLRTGRA